MKKIYVNPKIQFIPLTGADILLWSNEGEWDILKVSDGNIFNQ